MLFKPVISWQRIWLPKWARLQRLQPLMDLLQSYMLSLKILLCMEFRMLTVPTAKSVKSFGRYCSFLVLVSQLIVPTYICTQTHTYTYTDIYIFIHKSFFKISITHRRNHVKHILTKATNKKTQKTYSDKDDRAHWCYHSYYQVSSITCAAVY